MSKRMKELGLDKPKYKHVFEVGMDYGVGLEEEYGVEIERIAENGAHDSEEFELKISAPNSPESERGDNYTSILISRNNLRALQRVVSFIDVDRDIPSTKAKIQPL